MRVVALTADASLGVALSMMEEWEVVTAQSIDDAVLLSANASIVIVGMGDTDQGLAVAQEIFSRGVTIPSLVVGDVEAPPGSKSTVLSRPFTLDDLNEAVARTAEPPR